jgi:hypothetical protein
VLKNGTIIETGTHENLIAKDTAYASMWNKQAKAQKAAEDAHYLTLKAEKLMRKASEPGNDDDSSSSSDEGSRDAKARQQQDS